jgi:hypothetical protein
MLASGMLRCTVLARIDVSDEHIASIITVRRIGDVTANILPSSPILVTLMMRRYVPPKRRFLQEPHRVIFQKAAFFIVTAVETSNLT